MKKRRHIKRDREVNTFAHLWHTSRVLSDLGAQATGGSFHLFLSSVIFAAFALEAYLNHIGSKVFASWPELDRSLSPEAKLALLSERLSLPVNKGCRPWQTVTHAIRVRNKLAHGKTISIGDEYTEEYAEGHEPPHPQHILTDWEQFATQENAARAQEDIRAVADMLQKASGVADAELFNLGTSGISIKWMEGANQAFQVIGDPGSPQPER